MQALPNQGQTFAYRAGREWQAWESVSKIALQRGPTREKPQGGRYDRVVCPEDEWRARCGRTAPAPTAG